MNFLKVIFWEFVQNLPILAGFICAFNLWQQGWPWIAFACIAAGGVTGAMLIALTEARKVAGHREPLAVILINMVSMTASMFVIVVYLSANWSGWLTDLVIGALGGSALGVAQSLAARKKIHMSHCLALGVASPLVLIFVRWLLNTGWPAWVNVLSMSLLATLIISAIDYTPEKLNFTRLP